MVRARALRVVGAAAPLPPPRQAALPLPPTTRTCAPEPPRLRPVATSTERKLFRTLTRRDHLNIRTTKLSQCFVIDI